MEALDKSISVSVPEPIKTSAGQTDSIQKTVQEIDMQEGPLSTPGSDSDIYELL